MTGQRSCVRASISATSSYGNLRSSHRSTLRMDDFEDADAQQDNANQVGGKDKKEKVTVVLVNHSMHFYLSLAYINSSRTNPSSRESCP